MTQRRLARQQPASFAFTPENLAWAREVIARYPEGREASAVVPLLWRAQEQNGGWLPQAAMEVVAEMLNMSYIRVYEIATFYTMFNLHPVGRHHVQVCTTTPCWLRGSAEITAACARVMGTEESEVSADGAFSWIEVECLGACVNAPMVQIGKDYYEDLDAARMEALLRALARGEQPRPGSQSGRRSSEPEGGPTTLRETIPAESDRT